MEEYVGTLWHKLVTRAADNHHRDAAVTLQQTVKPAGILLRAMGGDGGLTIKAAQQTAHGTRRTWLQRVAGSGQKADLAWLDQETLHLPMTIDLFPTAALNRDLYLWLAALAAETCRASFPFYCEGETRRRSQRSVTGEMELESDWFAQNQQATLRLFERFPGMQSRYRCLLEAALALRPDPAKLATDESAQEGAIRQALQHPGSVEMLPPARKPFYPVHLWLHPAPPIRINTASQTALGDDEPQACEGASRTVKNQRRRSAERVEMPDEENGFMLFFRAESILSWADYIRVNRATDEDDNPDAEQAADDLEAMSVARDGKSTATRLRFDLDLPPLEADDAPLGEGILLPEWHFKKQVMQPNHCHLQPMIARNAVPAELPKHLAATARRIRNQFAALTPAKTWLKKQFDGAEVDLDACVQYRADRASGVPLQEAGRYQSCRARERDLSCLLLADLSLSTDAYVSDSARVIDVIRDGLFLFSEALFAAGDRFALYGFSSLKRDNVRFHSIKLFDEKYSAHVRGRIAAIKPGYYTRMGAAIRHASALLAQQPSAQRLLLLLTDGKPNDLDQYEGRYGIEDTRQALHEARKQGVQPFCVTIDEKDGDYLPYLFGAGGYVLVRKASELPKQLPLLYAQLTR